MVQIHSARFSYCKARKNTSFVKNCFTVTMTNETDEIYPLENLTSGFETEDIQRHITVLKWTGVTLIMLATILTPVIVYTGSMVQSKPPLDYEVKVTDSNNETACIYVKRYNLSDHVYLTVCNLNGEILIDIRQFFNQTASLRGIPLNLHQWYSLKQMSQMVDSAVHEARTYWRVLKKHATQ